MPVVVYHLKYFLILKDKAEVSSAEEQLTRNNLTGGNDKAVESKPTAFNQKSFLWQMS